MKNELGNEPGNELKSEQRWRQRPKKGRFHLFVIGILGLSLLIALAFGWYVFNAMYGPNIQTPDRKDFNFYIRTGAGFNEVKQDLFNARILRDRESFIWLAERKNYAEKVKAGRYVIKNGMTNDALLNMLRSGMQTPVKLSFNNLRDINQLAGRVSRQIEADSVSILQLLRDEAYLSKTGFSHETINAMFLPNTYEMYWNIDAVGFVSRMLQEYRSFWNEERRQKAKQLKMNMIEVSVLASIIDKETSANAEKPIVAGVYLNRLKNNWLLQADPTLIFALNDYSIRRVLDVHKKVNSKYNTYLYTGLPPGPICIPSLAGIDAVLNASKHNYFYFCAKDDFSGTHAFSKTYEEHLRNARKYQQALNNNKIYR